MTREISTNLIVAFTLPNFGIGTGENSLPWDDFFKNDLKRFKKITKGHTVLMGRKTWLSIPKNFRPLSGRVNVVLSKTLEISEEEKKFENFFVFSDYDDAVRFSFLNFPNNELFVIGGAGLFKHALQNDKNVTRAYVTRVNGFDKNCKIFVSEFSEFENSEKWKVLEISKTQNFSTPKGEKFSYDFVTFLKSSKINGKISPSLLSDECQYAQLIEKILENGQFQTDRTKVGTWSIFGEMMKFDLRESFPLLTTKKVFWKGVVEELLWFLRGDTNAKNLSDKGVHIWDGNGSREFLDSRGLKEREEGDLGPVYGFQWRHFGANYVDKNFSYDGQGIDQLKNLIETLRTNPNDRRMILTAWNPLQLDDMALPPCHLLCQFYVEKRETDEKGFLSCSMYQRSADVGLGVPFNIASYALLTCLIAHVTDLVPGDFVHFLGNAHIYKNHVDALKEQVKRTPRPFPILSLNENVKEIDNFTLQDIKLTGYNPLGKIAMEMAV